MRKIGVCVLLACLAATAHAQDAVPEAFTGQWSVQIIGYAPKGDTPAASIEIKPDGTYAGFSGCNRFSGGFKIAGNQVTLAPPAATKMMCAPSAMEQEQVFLAALGGDLRWVSDGANGILLSAGSNDRLHLVPATRHTDLTIRVPGAESVDRNTTRYRCGEKVISVEYINAGPVSLAVFAVGDDFVTASSVLSASGARYAGGHYEWWTKGDESTLTDLTDGSNGVATKCTKEG